MHNRGMTTEDQSRPVSAAIDDEAVALEHAAERLSERFPGVPRSHIDELVEMHHKAFEGAPVRDFVAVLIERDVKKDLQAETGPIRFP